MLASDLSFIPWIVSATQAAADKSDSHNRPLHYTRWVTLPDHFNNTYVLDFGRNAVSKTLVSLAVLRFMHVQILFPATATTELPAGLQLPAPIMSQRWHVFAPYSWASLAVLNHIQQREPRRRERFMFMCFVGGGLAFVVPPFS